MNHILPNYDYTFQAFVITQDTDTLLSTYFENSVFNSKTETTYSND